MFLWSASMAFNDILVRNRRSRWQEQASQLFILSPFPVRDGSHRISISIIGVVYLFVIFNIFSSCPACLWWHDNRFEVNWPPELTLVLGWISKFFLFGALPSDTMKIKHTKSLKEIPSRHVLENLLEKSKHSCLYTSETQWQFTGILPIYNGRHAKFHNSKL